MVGDSIYDRGIVALSVTLFIVLALTVMLWLIGQSIAVRLLSVVLMMLPKRYVYYRPLATQGDGL